MICNRFGLSSIDLAEDIVSDTFLKAAETWGMKGIPEHPTSWLYTVAKNNAKDYFKRKNIFNEKISPTITDTTPLSENYEIDISEGNIQDSQLKMIFAVCDPCNAPESQIVLALRILCGFGIDEIANALLSNKATINKRLYRAKKNLQHLNLDHFELDNTTINKRLSSVLTVLYLLFNEGYYSSNPSYTIRKDLCYEAMRLLYMLCKNTYTDVPKTNGLMALFCFHTSRFDARLNKKGEFILFDEQDQSLWNIDLIQKGEWYLTKSATSISKYYLEALIAYWHTRKDMPNKEKWENILQAYNRLLQIEYSPIAAINRTFALAKAYGNETALKEALKLQLDDNFYYHCLLVDLYQAIDPKKQQQHLKLALSLTNNKQTKNVLKKKYGNTDAL
ncbi:MAG: sigma-70 family RNA polymerase sigma factor [Chitinophagales bacterium]|nr:sigma-70 family RNA polymerase sigma factor [Chitinophagales bacterium]